MMGWQASALQWSSVGDGVMVVGPMLVWLRFLAAYPRTL